MKIIAAIICCLLLWGCHPADNKIYEYQIIPYPQEITYNNGVFRLKPQLKVAYPTQLEQEVAYLKGCLAEDWSIQVTPETGKKSGDINFIISPDILPDHPEGYILTIEKKKITIKANASTGVFYGIQTLRQLIRNEENRLFMQAGVITDYPTFGWRAFMLDEARYFKGKEVVYRLLDEMAQLKMNVFHWHLTNDQGWRIEIKKYPLLTETGAFRDSSEINHFHSNVFDGKPHGGFYTQEEIKEILEYAARRHVTVVPEVSMPGHASAAIAAYPWLGTTGKQIKVSCMFGVMYDVFNVADPQVLSFFEDVIDEVVALFPAPVFHIGGDEVRYNQWKESPAILAYMKKHNLETPAELQVYFTNEISKLLASKNRRMMGWNEITGAKLHEYQSGIDTGNTQQLAPGTIVHFWKGDTALIRQTIENGYDIVNSYHIYTYIDYSYESIPLEKAYNFNPVPEGLTGAQQKRVLGLGCQMWGEFIPTEDDMDQKVFPRIAAYAETGWTLPDRKDYSRFSEMLDSFLKKWDQQGISYGSLK